jgi:hypothetical protein
MWGLSRSAGSSSMDSRLLPRSDLSNGPIDFGRVRPILPAPRASSRSARTSTLSRQPMQLRGRSAAHGLARQVESVLRIFNEPVVVGFMTSLNSLIVVAHNRIYCTL